MDSAEQLRDLRDHYKSLNDAALRRAGNEAYNLTDVARSVLRDEIQSRRLEIHLQDVYREDDASRNNGDWSNPGVVPEERDLMALRKVWTEEEARRVKEVLTAAGIPSYFGPLRVEQVSEIRANYEEGVDVKIWVEDQQRSLQALQALPQEGASEGYAEYRAECPRCKSAEIVFCDLSGERFNWRCDACGHEWQDEGVEERG